MSYPTRTHGNASTYRNGCRCDPCRDAHRERTRVYRDRNARRLKQDRAAVKHGSDTTYNDFRCRCGECRRAHTERQTPRPRTGKGGDARMSNWNTTGQRNAAIRGKPLSRQEIEVLTAISMGYADGQTAAMLGIAASTVRTYVSSMTVKLGASNRAHLVRLGFIGGYLRLSQQELADGSRMRRAA